MTIEQAPSAAAEAAENAGIRALLTCWLREVPSWTFDAVPFDAVPSDGTSHATTGSTPADPAHIRIPLPRWNAHLLVGIRRRSATFRHDLIVPPELHVTGTTPRPIGLSTLTMLLTDALPEARSDDARGTGRPDELLARVLDSAAAVTEHLTDRALDVDRLFGAEQLTFADTEQALLLGHLSHPTPKSRGEMSRAQRRRFAPETSGRFQLRWLAVDAELVRHDSATGTSAPDLAERLLRDDPATDDAALDATLRAVGGRRLLLPAHPYEADLLADDDATAWLFDSGAVVDLGPWGSPFAPTTSVRTVHRADAEWQLKFSLHVRVTNSMRVTLPKELDRAVESARLARTDVGRAAAAAAPRFHLVQDPAYLTVVPGDGVQDGFSVLLRENPWTSGGPSDVSALTTLCQDHPYGGRSRLAAIVAAIAERERRTEPDAAREWFTRFGEVVIRSLIRLYADVGLCFEAHQQNTLVELADGWPVRGFYRDSQGYFHRAAAHDDLAAVVPGLGEETESIFDEALADERLVYYLFVNLTLGVVNALGACTDEDVLLGDLRRLLVQERAHGGRYPLTLLDRLLDDDRWPCKANLLTRVHDMDELVGDIATQSVYVSLPNPLRDRT